MIRLGIAFESGFELDSSRPKSWKEANHWFEEAAQMDDCDEGNLFFSHGHVTLYEGLSVRPSVGRSVGPSVSRFFNRGIQAKK